jgi:hypothetical protein
LKLAPMKGAQFIRAEDVATRPVAAEAPTPEAVAGIDVPESPRPEKPGNKKQTASNTRKFDDVMKSLGAGQ